MIKNMYEALNTRNPNDTSFTILDKSDKPSISSLFIRTNAYGDII